MFQKQSPLSFLKNLGNKQLAEYIANRCFNNVKAYQDFVTKRGLTGMPASFEELPLTDKDNYLLPSFYEDLLADDHHKATLYLRSSNHKNAFYWPQYNITAIKGLLLRSYFEMNYNIHHNKSACIVAASLGSWAGGTSFAYYVENVSDITEYPFSVFTAGNNVEEIIEFVLKYDSQFSQFILFLCPSFITYIFDTVEALGLRPKFPFHKLRFSAIGEPFNESFREHIDALCCPQGNVTSLLSIYGSADTDIIGAESLASAALRKILYQNENLANAMGLNKILPNFFHFYAANSYIEESGGNLCVSKWQGIPLVRYNLHDNVLLYGWKELRKFLLSHEPPKSESRFYYNIIEAAGDNLPDIVALFGRSDSHLKLKGSYITEIVLDNIIHSKELSKLLTGHYKASVEYDERDHQYLSMLLELKHTTEVSSSETSNYIYKKIIDGLCDFQDEFKKDYQEIYKEFDDIPDKKILRLSFCKWPNLSQQLSIKTKRRGIEKNIK